MALDENFCKVKGLINSSVISEGTRLISGKSLFRSPGKPAFYMECQLAYMGQPKNNNIIGGLSVGVDCR